MNNKQIARRNDAALVPIERSITKKESWWQFKLFIGLWWFGQFCVVCKMIDQFDYSFTETVLVAGYVLSLSFLALLMVFVWLFRERFERWDRWLQERCTEGKAAGLVKVNRNG
jgi:hypothetical protein